ncbi:MAG: FKBP-type peptidyl-prolyl cis-trans isomerase [Planctomycetota bacterium]|jgi:FKBP-type peptidyl-prolyl cis-trans isomerase FkpA|nr:FKBP-type peptidyl-prolyl cis-trans isomerase [Planctomycetota bacterium]
MGRGNRQTKKRGGAGQGRASAEEFLTKNAQRPEVITTETGLQLEHLVVGEGAVPSENNTVTVDQRIKLLNGNIIGDTFRDNRPDTFSLLEAVEGYREGILQMREGGRTVFYCPPDLAWGKKGAGSKIPPNALLIYDVRLRAIR